MASQTVTDADAGVKHEPPWALIALTDEAWMADAACHEHPEVNWFPERGQSAEPAKKVCGDCLVRSECLDYALRQGRVDREALAGVWGGTTGRERRRAVQSGGVVEYRRQMYIGDPKRDDLAPDDDRYAPAANVGSRDGQQSHLSRSHWYYMPVTSAEGFDRHTWDDSAYFQPRAS